MGRNDKVCPIPGSRAPLALPWAPDKQEGSQHHKSLCCSALPRAEQVLWEHSHRSPTDHQGWQHLSCPDHHPAASTQGWREGKAQRQYDHKRLTDTCFELWQHFLRKAHLFWLICKDKRIRADPVLGKEPTWMGASSSAGPDCGRLSHVRGQHSSRQRSISLRAPLLLGPTCLCASASRTR